MILRRDPVNSQALDRLSGVLEAVKRDEWSRARTLRGDAIIEVATAEMALAEGRRSAIDGRMRALRAPLLRALATAPSDSFLWFLMFRQASMAEGFKPEWLSYLARSYQLGPNEGWIGVRRSGLALAIFPRLPPELAEKAVTEFVGLVRSQYRDAAQILVGPGWAERDRLLSRLEGIPAVTLKGFVTAVSQLGREVVVPGVKPREARPWDR